jgi:plastocyanin
LVPRGFNRALTKAGDSAVRTSLVSGVAAGFVLIVATACGGSTATTQPVASAAGHSAAPAAASQAAAGGAPTCSSGIGTGQQVAIAGFKFTPATLTVGAGSTVSWTNGDSTAHTVTFDNGPDCGNLNQAASTTVTFSAAGTYAYHCKIHPTMTGSVTVS